MTADDRRQLDELDSQRRDVLVQRDRLQEELRAVPASLHLIEVRRKLILDSGPATSGTAAGASERDLLGINNRMPVDAGA